MTAKLYVRRGGGAAADTEYTQLNPSLRKGAPVFNRDEPLIQLGMRFEEGEASQGTFQVLDSEAEIPTSTFRLPPHAVVTLTEDASGDELWLARGRIAPLENGRRAPGVGGDEVEWDVTVSDANMDMRGLPFSEAWVRPAETDVQRLNALQLYILNGASSTSPNFRETTTITVGGGGVHLCPNSNTVTMPAKTYPKGTQPADVLADCRETAGKIGAVVIHHRLGASHLCLLYIKEDDHTTYATAVKISDQIADWDPEHATAPVFEPHWRMGKATAWDHDFVTTALVSIWGGTNDEPEAIYVDRPSLIGDYEYWGETYHDSESETEAQAELRANRELDYHHVAVATHRASILVSAAQTKLLCAGMSLQVKSAAIAGGPDLGTYVTRRIAELKWEPNPDGRWWAHMQLGRGLRLRPPRRGSVQPKSTTPKPPTPGTGAEFVESNAVGADSPDMSLGIAPGEANLLMLDFVSTDATVAASAEYQDVNDPPTFVDASPQALTELEFVPTSDHDMTLLALDDPDIATGDSARILHEHPDGRHAAAVLLYRGATIAGLGDLQSGNGTSASPSITVTTSAGDLVVGALGWHYYDTGSGTAGLILDSNQTHLEFASKSGTHRSAIAAAQKVATGSSTTLSWGLTASRQYSVIAVVLPGASTGDTTEPVGEPGTGSTGTNTGVYAPIDHVHPHGLLSESGVHQHDAADSEYDSEDAGGDATNVQEALDDHDTRLDVLEAGDTIVPPGDFIVGTLSNPPTQSEIEATIGAPAARGTVYGLQDSGTEKRYLAISDGVQWHIVPIVVPAEVSGVTALTSAPAGGWAQTHPVAYYNGVTYFSYVRGDNGNIEVRTYTHATSTVSSATVVHAALLADTHASPSLVVAQLDHRIHIFHSNHAGSAMHEWISTNPEDISAGTDSNIDSQLGGSGYTYPMDANLDSGLYLIIRPYGGASADQIWSYAVSTVNGTWSTLTDFFTVSGRTAYPYLNKTGDDRIDFMAINGSSLESNESILFFSYDAIENEWTAADGTVLTLPVGDQAEIMVWDGSVVDDALGRYDVRRGLDGHPRVLFASMNGATYTLRHARWDGSAWVFTALFSGTEPVQGDASFDSMDTNIVYFTDSSNEIRRLTTLDEVTWSSETLTTGTTSVYPTSPDNHHPSLPVLWLTGSFTDSATYNVGTSGYGLTAAAGSSDHLQRIVVLDDTTLKEIVIHKTAGGDWEVSFDGSSWEALGGGGSPTGAAGGDLSGTYPNPSVVDDSHSHTSATAPGGGLGPLILASDHATPIVFDDILQASDGSDFLYASEP